eukprot:8793632-Pyramimonas_sp.AAC.1
MCIRDRCKKPVCFGCSGIYCLCDLDIPCPTRAAPGSHNCAGRRENWGREAEERKRFEITGAKGERSGRNARAAEAIGTLAARGCRPPRQWRM